MTRVDIMASSLYMAGKRAACGFGPTPLSVSPPSLSALPGCSPIHFNGRAS
jgi:hypothetical protein